VNARSDQLRIAVAGLADIDAVMEVMAAAFRPEYGEAWTAAQLRSLFAVPGTRTALAMIDAAPAGFYAARLAGPESELLLLAVLPQLRRRGVGRRLLDHWREWAAGNGVSEYFLEMRANNPARCLYESAGFVESGRRKNYYTGSDGQMLDAITMHNL
jgi:[ribosomal protein S18]-alanine N-acetyltransferase